MSTGLLVVTPTRFSQQFGYRQLQQSAITTVRWVLQPLYLTPWLNRSIDIYPDWRDEVIRLRLAPTGRKRVRTTIEAAGFEIVPALDWGVIIPGP